MAPGGPAEPGGRGQEGGRAEKGAPLAQPAGDVRPGRSHPEVRGQAGFGLVVLLLHTGLRVAEVCTLTLDDVVIRERFGMVQVREGKGGK